MSIFVKPLKLNAISAVETLHYAPELLDAAYIEKGFFVESEPTPVYQAGKTPVLMANPETHELWYEYADRELTREERLDELESQNAQIILSLVANDLM